MTEGGEGLKIGDLDDGGVYVGPSAEDGKPLHATLADEPEHLTLDEAFAAADRLKSVHPTAHVPTPNELNANLYENRGKGALKGTFNIKGSFLNIAYRSSLSFEDRTALTQWFDDGHQNIAGRADYRLPVRLVW